VWRLFTILQLSDLHRAANEPFSNEEIMSSLVADVSRYPSERPPISKPEAIIVSGDLVQGLPLRATAYPAGLVAQYEVALELLKRLAETFVGGDHSKLVMIPGNHDVDFNQSLASMAKIKVRKENVKGLLFSNAPDNPHRWNWNDGKVYKIANPTAYEDRFRYYCDTFNKFYDGVSLAFRVDPTEYSNLFELDDGRIVVAAFNSCNGNDCFNHVGEIPQAEIAKCHLKISRSGKQYRLKMAVWHHDVAGPPRRSDYMDSAVVKLMIDRGFRLGLHGHQHKANAAPDWVYTARRTSMVVVSAGSLCAGTYDIPRGVSREYNVIEIDSSYAKARVHVREAKVSNIFAAGRFIDIGSESYEDVEWVPEESAPARPTGATAETPVARVARIEALIAAGRAADAIAELEVGSHGLGRYGHMLLTRALNEAKNWPRLLRHLTSPESSDEAALLVTAMVKQKQWQEAKDFLKTPSAKALLSEPEITHLEQMVRAEEAISR
jgi:Calcineurin-like phosphoesterase